MADTRIPRKDSIFDQYIRNSATALQVADPAGTAAWQRLLLTSAENDQWLAYRDQWAILYPKYTDKAIRTVSIKNQKNTLKKDFISFAEDILTRMAGSKALTPDERVTFNLKERDRTPTVRPAITTAPFILLKALGGQRIRFELRVEGDQTRPSMHPHCDVVELRGLIGNTPPQNYKACDKDYSSSKARFIKELEPENFGKYVYVFARWKNQTDDSKSGPWSELAQVGIA